MIFDVEYQDGYKLLIMTDVEGRDLAQF